MRGSLSCRPVSACRHPCREVILLGRMFLLMSGLTFHMFLYFSSGRSGPGPTCPSWTEKSQVYDAWEDSGAPGETWHKSMSTEKKRVTRNGNLLAESFLWLVGSKRTD